MAAKANADLRGASEEPDVLTAVGVAVLKEEQWGNMMPRAAGEAKQLGSDRQDGLFISAPLRAACWD